MQLCLDEPSVKVEIHQLHNMETVVLNRRMNNQDRKPATVVKMRRAKRDGRNPSTGATLIARFINRRAKRNGIYTEKGA
mgnify:CR=1 FL=1